MRVDIIPLFGARSLGEFTLFSIKRGQIAVSAYHSPTSFVQFIICNISITFRGKHFYE